VKPLPRHLDRLGRLVEYSKNPATREAAARALLRRLLDVPETWRLLRRSLADHAVERVVKDCIARGELE
jgi:hypothetical protein